MFEHKKIRNPSPKPVKERHLPLFVLLAFLRSPYTVSQLVLSIIFLPPRCLVFAYVINHNARTWEL